MIMNRTCDKFEPTIFEGQLCYSLDVSKFGEKTTREGKKNGLILLLDPNPYLLNYKDKIKKVSSANDLKNFKINIRTLAQYTAYGPGLYAMSALKKMTGTKSFLQLPENQKRCQIHNREKCQTISFLDQVEKNCVCVPWSLMTNTGEQKVTIPLFT